MSAHYRAETPLGRFVSELEETAIAVLLGLMTIITFINVVLRYGFNTGIIWGLEMTTFLFAWLVLFGVSYAVKTTAHLGVDAVINLFSGGTRRVLAIVAGLDLRDLRGVAFAQRRLGLLGTLCGAGCHQRALVPHGVRKQPRSGLVRGNRHADP